MGESREDKVIIDANTEFLHLTAHWLLLQMDC